MKNFILSWLFYLLCKSFAVIPLRFTHFLGSHLGLIFHAFAEKTQLTLVENLKQSAIFSHDIALHNAIKINQQEMGKAMLESLAIWGSSQSNVLSKIKDVNNLALLNKLTTQKRGIIFLTPHIGAYEVASIFYAAQHPITVLYRPPRKAWMNKCLLNGRVKGQIKLAPTTLSGVRKLYLALKQGEAVGILPDQIASKGEGEWADFFGKPVYTMALVSNLAKRTGAEIIMAVAERLPKGEGFALHLEHMTFNQIANPTLLNQQIEQAIRKFPMQYMWSYDRYKKP